jgi:hypothetical protein
MLVFFLKIIFRLVSIILSSRFWDAFFQKIKGKSRFVFFDLILLFFLNLVLYFIIFLFCYYTTHYCHSPVLLNVNDIVAAANSLSSPLPEIDVPELISDDSDFLTTTTTTVIITIVVVATLWFCGVPIPFVA